MWERHITNEQPPETYGKTVIYRCHQSNLIHKAHPADELIWMTMGDKAPTIGRISEYRIVE